LPKGITGKVQRTRLREIVSEASAPTDTRLRTEIFQLWSKLKQFATFKAPRRISVDGQLPRGTTGEVQRTQPREIISEKLVLPEGRLHAELLQIWKKLLKVESLSIDDDFFEKGGNSLLAMDLHAEIERLTAKSLPESFLFESSTIRALTKALSS
jgi:hypothetical protein